MRAALPLLPLLTMLATATHARTLGELERALVREPPATTPFTEYRFTRLLKRAAVATGTLEYRAAGQWVREVTAPVAERAEISGDEVRMRRGDRERRFALARAPQLRMLIDSLEALLGGRISSLNADYEVTLISRDAAWGLRLEPRDARLAKTVARIDVFGSGDVASCIEVVEPDGDASVTLLGENGLASAAPAADGADASSQRRRVEARCRTVAIGTDAG